LLSLPVIWRGMMYPSWQKISAPLACPIKLYRAIGSVSANIAEGYSRRSGKDQARFYKYALGSAREARGWYYQGRHVLSETVTTHRIKLLTQIIRLLLTIIPAERGYKLKEERASYYDVGLTDLLDNIPMP
jgi:four helix bundle protein